MKTKETTPSSSLEEAKKYFNLLLSGNNKGGITKSTSVGACIDSLQDFGYFVRRAEAEAENPILSAMLPNVELVNYKDEDAMDAFVGSLLESEHEGNDLTVLDLPGDSGQVLMSYFTPERLDAFTAIGIRLIVGLTLVEDIDAIVGATLYMATFHKHAEFIAIASKAKTGRTPDGKEKPFGRDEIASFPGGSAINDLIGDRIISIPRFSEKMVADYARCKGIPSAYLPGGPAYRELGLSFGAHFPWQSHRNRVLANVAPYAEWLTGRPIPKPQNVPMAADYEAQQEREKYLAELRSGLKRPVQAMRK